MICGVCLEMTGCRVSYCRLRSLVAALVLVDGEKKAAGRYFLPFFLLFGLLRLLTLLVLLLRF